MNQPLIDGVQGIPTTEPNVGKTGYHSVLSKVPSNSNSVLYKR